MEDTSSEAKLTEGREQRRASLAEATERLRTLNERARSYIKEHPAACLAGALALGFGGARLARWRSS
jgi:ElaB/YqjD/DUF883 family membrane-anchored ribosome-binding protein